MLQAVAPEYPPLAASARASGTVIIEARVDARGSVASVHTVEGLRLLGAAAEDSARRWVFAPANGQAGFRVARLTFTFRLMPDDAAPSDLAPIFRPLYQVEVRRATPKVVDNPDTDPPMSRRSSRSRKKRREQESKGGARPDSAVVGNVTHTAPMRKPGWPPAP